MSKAHRRHTGAVAETLIDHLDRHEVASFHAAGNSMSPLVREGDHIAVRKVPLERLATGDLVVMHAGDGMVVHRLLGKRRSPEGLRLVTKGDRLSRKDVPWDPARYVGRVDAVAGSTGRIDLTSLRWRGVSRAYGALAKGESIIFAWLNGMLSAGGGRLGFLRHWLARAVRAPGKGLLYLALAGSRGTPVTTAEQRRRFFYACLSADHSTVKKICGSLQMDDQAWTEVLAEDERCRLRPLLHHSLSQQRNLVPEWVVGTIAEAHLRARGHNVNLMQNLHEVHHAFRAADIPVVLLKGAAFLTEGEGLDFGRPTSDLDLLVKEHDRARAAETLGSLGYEFVENGKSTPIKYDDAIGHRQGKATNWINQKRRVVVDLHTHLLQSSLPLTVDMDTVWRGATLTKVQGEPGLVLGLEHMLIHIALHASWSDTYRAGMGWLYDIGWIVKSSESRFDWEEFLRRTREWGATRVVYWPLKIARESLGTPVPATVLAELAPGRVTSRLTRWALRRLDVLPGRRNPSEGDDRLAKALYRQLVSGPGVPAAKRLTVLIQTVFPETHLADRGHEPSAVSVLAGMMMYLKPSKLRRAFRILIKSIAS